MPELEIAVADAIDYCHTHAIEVPLELEIKARKLGAIKAGGDISSINAKYHDTITSSLTDYFGGANIRTSASAFKRSMVEAFGSAFDLGYTDGGAELPFAGDALDWFNARVDQELAYIDGLFQQAKQLKKEDGFDYFAWATARADAYTNSVSGVYNAAVLWGKGNQMLTWHLGQTEKHCDTCQSLADGPAHRASWFISRDYIPRKPWAGMDCGGFNCDCSLTDKNGNDVTI